MKRVLLAISLSAAVFLGGCSGASVSVTTGPTATAIPATGVSLAASDFAAAAKLPGTVLLDVRTPAEYAEGHLPGARNIDVESSGFAQELARLDRAGTYAVYCRSGNRSKAAMSAMQQVGFAHLFDLAGGITAWTSADGDVVRG